MIKLAEIKDIINHPDGIEAENTAVSSGCIMKPFHFAQKMPQKGDAIPQDDQPEEIFEFIPSRSLPAPPVNPDKNGKSAEQKQDMTDLVGDERFCAAMDLDGVNRFWCKYLQENKCNEKEEFSAAGEAFWHFLFLATSLN